MSLIRKAVETKALLCGWSMSTRPGSDCVELVFTRDNWQVSIGYDTAGKPISAGLCYPGSGYPAYLSLGLVSRYLVGNRVQMSAFHKGQRIVCGPKAGVVEDIIPDDRHKVRLVVHYDDSSVGEPYTTHVRAEQAEVAV